MSSFFVFEEERLNRREANARFRMFRVVMVQCLKMIDLWEGKFRNPNFFHFRNSKEVKDSQMNMFLKSVFNASSQSRIFSFF